MPTISEHSSIPEPTLLPIARPIPLASPPLTLTMITRLSSLFPSVFPSRGGVPSGGRLASGERGAGGRESNKRYGGYKEGLIYTGCEEPDKRSPASQRGVVAMRHDPSRTLIVGIAPTLLHIASGQAAGIHSPAVVRGWRRMMTVSCHPPIRPAHRLSQSSHIGNQAKGMTR